MINLKIKNLLETICDKSKDYIFESHVPALFDLLGKEENKKMENDNSSIATKNDSLLSNTSKKSTSAKKENGSANKSKNEEEQKIGSNTVNIFKNIFQINL